MTYGMTFRGEIAFAERDDIDRAFAEATTEVVKDAALDRSSFEVVGDGRTLRLDSELSAPASIWEPTVAMLSVIIDHAKRGRVLCVFEGDGVEDQIEVAGADEDSLSSGPFPTAFVGTLTFATGTLDAPLRELRAMVKELGLKLDVEVSGSTVSMRQRIALFRRGWAQSVHMLQTLAKHASAGAIDTKIAHTYLPDGEVMKIEAGKTRPTVVWD